MAMKGTSNEASLPDIIQLISQGKRTGVLSVTNRKDFGDIYFKDGNIVYSTIVNNKFKLCDILISAQEITREEAEKAIEIQKTDDFKKRIGEILIELDFITKDKLLSYVKKQIEEVVFTIFKWENIYFNFEPNIHPPKDLEIISFRPEDILLKIATRIDEWDLLKDKIPKDDTVLTKRKDIDLTTLEIREIEIFEIVNGKRNLKEIFKLAPYTKFEVCKIIYILLNKNAIAELGTKKISNIEILSQIEEHRNLGIAFLKTDMFNEAIREFKTIISQDRENAEIYFYIGLSFHKKGQLKEAINYYQKSYNINPKKLALINNYAVLLEEMEQFSRIEDLYKNALSIDVTNKKLIANLGIYYFKTGKLDDAAELLSEAAAEDQSLIYPLAYLAECSLHQNNLDNAIGFIEEIIERKFKTPEIFSFLGMLFIKKGDLPKAEECFLNAINADNRYLNSHIELANLYYKKGKFSDAKDHLNMIIQLNGDDFETLFKLGNIYFKERKFESALKYWEKALIFEPNNSTLRKNIRLLKEQTKGK
jgi:tetratricopeptide (TPR) repeat protein